MRGKKTISVLLVMLIALAGLEIVRIYTGDGVSQRPEHSKFSSFLHTIPDAPAPEVASPPTWRNATAHERNAAQQSIHSQLDAFRTDDYFKATYFQSAGLRSHFRNVDGFRTMMVRNYPQFAKYKSVKFGDARANKPGDEVMVEATVTGVDGIVQKAVYTMHLESGIYRVESVAGGQMSAIGGPGREQRS